jgi:hypothetical protein
LQLDDGQRMEILDAADYVDFFASGDAAVGAFVCSACRYGVTVQRTLPLCPMCGGGTWERGPWSPFTRLND